ncbi:SigE family RNA polymerase sigma factor [Nocardioides anomalus]|uniref:SigE family RNA polymerase sigma factor n=1 Tax=Nocardioides anomalus TaxID=2712223 RepID=A0A6G6WJW4_9ACTN|nr:SigE family RNA polymerase sigma factor [Nocardioides anomalus]QIG45534.1 SigE family RNA polymerase sigma factor [Nocardioides anomalus]
MNRDDASYVEFVAASQDRLRRIAYAVCADDNRAEDVLQEALVKLYLAWPKVRDRGAEEAYARRVIVNADLDDRRRPWHRRRQPVDHDALLDVPAAARLPVGERLDLLDAVRRLPAMQRRTVVLRHWLGLSVEETAAELGISEGTVKSHTSRGLTRLGELLDDPQRAESKS